MNFLSKVIIWAYGAYRKLTSISNYAVIEKALEYTVRPGVRYEIDDDFWLAEEKYWDLDTDEEEDHHYVIVTDRDFSKTVIPQNVAHPILRIKYYYNNKRYKLVTDNIDYAWPPREQEGAMFILPITSAVLMDHDDKPVRDITEKIRRCAGPRQDFHGQGHVRIRDLLYYDDETLEKDLPKIKITNSFGMSKVVSTTTGLACNLKFP